MDCQRQGFLVNNYCVRGIKWDAKLNCSMITSQTDIRSSRKMFYAPAFYVILFLGLHPTDAVRLVFKHGIDVSSLVSKDSFKCLRILRFDFLIVRYRNIRDGEPDSNVVQTLANAKEAGFKDIHVYMFPCSHDYCKKPRK